MKYVFRMDLIAPNHDGRKLENFLKKKIITNPSVLLYIYGKRMRFLKALPNS